ncbi:MAG: DNA polymerase III subunit gamma/tau [Spirulina sp.]
MSYEPLHHKYRPQRFIELVGQEAIAQTLTHAIESGRIAPAYLFTGPRGTGKTSSARILSKSLNCLQSDTPTPNPCGKCEVCLQIARGSAMDVIEIDAASNTGVDNIREIIERAQFAPVQCRYKVYVIDECLTGDSLIQTSEGLMRIDDPQLKGKMVLSYNESAGVWEYKKVLRWLERGIKETFVIKTGDRELRCTENHLIRTEKGWIKAKNVKEGMKILSPVNVDVERLSINMEWMEESAQNFILENLQERHTTISKWGQSLAENGCQIYNNTQFPQWITNLEKVESVSRDGYEKVYDLEVEDNHNFVANGLLVHNCHMLSTPAFNALLKTLEEPPNRVIFVLATTDPQRVLNTIISRCQRFDFRRIPLTSMVTHLTDIAAKEEIDIASDALTLVAQIANGGLRDAESLLDQLSLIPDRVTVEKVWDLVGAVPERDLLALIRAIHSDNPEATIAQCRHLMDRGREPLIVLQNLATFYLNLLIAKTSPQRHDLVAVTAPTWQELCEEAKQWSVPVILQGQQKLKESEVQIKNTTQPRLWLEVTLLGLLPSAIAASFPTNTTSQNIERSAKTQSTSPSLQPERVPPKSQLKSEIIQSQPRVEKTPPPQTEESTKIVSTPVSTQNLSDEERFQKRVEESWQKILKTIQPNAVRALVQQHCTLINFDVDESIADVAVPSQPLLKMAENKKPNIEAAFEEVWQQKIKVQFQVEKKNGTLKVGANSDPIAKKNNATSVQSPRSSTNAIAKSVPEIKAQPISQNGTVKPKDNRSVTSSFSGKNTTITESSRSQIRTKIEEKNQGDRVPSSSTLQPENQPPEPPTIEPKTEEENETILAANEFASIFDGEILDLELEILNDSDPPQHHAEPQIIHASSRSTQVPSPPPAEDPNEMPF